MIEKYKSRRIRVAIRHTLMAHWDPIGVKDVPAAWDEYDSYIGDVYELLVRQATADQIASYLLEIETVRMGLTYADGNPCVAIEHLQSAAAELQRAFDEQMLTD